MHRRQPESFLNDNKNWHLCHVDHNIQSVCGPLLEWGTLFWDSWRALTCTVSLPVFRESSPGLQGELSSLRAAAQRLLLLAKRKTGLFSFIQGGTRQGKEAKPAPREADCEPWHQEKNPCVRISVVIQVRLFSQLEFKWHLIVSESPDLFVCLEK